MDEQSTEQIDVGKFKTWQDSNFPDDYRAVCYTIWYQNSKPTAKNLHEIIPVDERSGKKPNVQVLDGWIKESFAEAAIVTDEKAMDMLHKDSAALKVEMLERHAGLGRKMQDIAVEYFETHGIETLKARDAINMLVAGIKVERESRFPEEKAFSKLAEMDDKQLMAELENMAKTVILDVESEDANTNNTNEN